MIKISFGIFLYLLLFSGKAQASHHCAVIFNDFPGKLIKNRQITEVTIETFDFIENLEVDGYLEALPQPTETPKIRLSDIGKLIRLGKQQAVDIFFLNHLRGEFFRKHQPWLEEHGFELIENQGEYQFKGRYSGNDSLQDLLFQLATGFGMKVEWALLSRKPAFKIRKNGEVTLFIGVSFIESEALARQILDEALWAVKRYKYSTNTKKSFGFVLTNDLEPQVVSRKFKWLRGDLRGNHPQSPMVRKLLKNTSDFSNPLTPQGRIANNVRLSFDDSRIPDDAIGIQSGRNQVLLNSDLLTKGREDQFVEALLHEAIHVKSVLASLYKGWPSKTARYYAGRMIEFETLEGQFSGLSPAYHNYFRADEVESNLKTYPFWKNNSNNKLQIKRLLSFIDWQIFLLEQSRDSQIIRMKASDGVYGIKVDIKEGVFKVIVDINVVGTVSKTNTFDVVREIIEDRIVRLKRQKEDRVLKIAEELK